MNAGDVVKALAAKYKAPEYAFFTDVRNSVGFSSRVRTADAMAMFLWPSRGLYMTGFEVKVSRADWKKELEQPEKAKPMEAVLGAARAQPCVRCGSVNTRPPSASDESFETIPICADCGC